MNSTRIPFNNKQILTITIEVLMCGALLEAFFYNILTPLIVNKSIPILSMLPFNLLPLDILIYPLFFAFIPLIINTRIEQKWLFNFILWLLMCILGVIVGVINQNPYYSSDVRSYIIRPFYGAIFYVAFMYIDYKKIFNVVVNFSLILAIILVFGRFLSFIGINVINSDIGGWVPELFLFSYAILFMNFVYQDKRTRWGALKLIILALGILIDFWKPVILGFMLLHFVAAMLLIGSKVKLNLKSYLIVVIFVCIIAGALFVVSNGYYLDEFLVKYLKVNAQYQDLSGNRFEIWSNAIKLWETSPIIGTGFGRLLGGILFDAGLGVNKEIEVYFTHNFSIKILYQLGIIGFSIYVICLFRFFSFAMKRLKYIVPKDMAAYKGVLTFILVTFFIAQVGESLDNSSIGLFFWGSIGIQAAMASKALAVYTQTVILKKKSLDLLAAKS